MINRNSEVSAVVASTVKDISRYIVIGAAAGLVLTSPFAGQALIGALGDYFIEKHRLKIKEINSRTLSQSVYYLNKRKLINIQNVGGKKIITLTQKGKKRKLAYDLENMKINKQTKWDGKWRILMFDIPEKIRVARDSFRTKLRQLGFVRFQQSVWICPYPCENEIDFIGELFRIRSHLNLITANIENDQLIRRKFDL
ncbi:MAG: CRISPR-associated endonuclease Cas2 [Candidatus Colwellbacteria bacterium RIFCSPLOWO2_01_FULL_48_10]|uniref:CRISPR-associated endonuclease Cas2 n=1 Tax=Candidatus Colwellbacteria bacterium RIFCSPLOWO2_01_FULL_48_10 TaxID=1797690 RepID=A0A1G1Z552_9BACT|nr:MAG: CRISPR-associated endonuclease Cas2 [Candidatus Colwellbacteria bacterium RIFCSPLOWO2_01_FULL_48_10]